jgi:hypothetical protein
MNEFLEVQASYGNPGTSGWWERVLPELTPDQNQSLHEAAANPLISHRTISVVLNRWGFKVSPGQIGHWRRNRAS